MPRNYPRVERVERLAREVLGEAVQALRDPRIGFITVTGVKMSPDLRRATLYVSVLGGEEERAESMAALRRAGHHLRSVMGREVRLKFLPSLEIEEDTTAVRGERIEEILRAVRRSEPPADRPDEDDGEERE